MRILIAEDERDLNKILAQRLIAEHYSVDSCMAVSYTHLTLPTICSV